MIEDQSTQDTQTISDDLRRYSALIWQWAWLLCLAGGLAAITAFLVSMRITPVYQAKTTLLINEAPSTKAADYSSLLTSERLARTYSEMLTKTPVLQSVIDELMLDIDVRQLSQLVQVELVRDTQLIEVRVENINPDLAADIANRIVAVFAEQTRSLQASRYSASKTNLETQLTRIDEQIQETADELAAIERRDVVNSERDSIETALAQYRQTYASLLQSYEQVRVAEAGSTSNIVQIEPATSPERPIRPRTLTNTTLAGLFGLLLSTGVIFLVEALDDTIHSPEDVTRDLNLPVLALVIRHDSQNGQLITIDQPRSPVSESFRSLRTNLQYASVDNPLNTLLVTSPSPSDGKTTIAANLGVVLAQGGRKVIIVDADMRRPRVHKVFNIANKNGMSNLFVMPRINLDGSVQNTMTDGLMALPAGEIPPNPAELLGSEKMVDILKILDKQADTVIIDSPPVMAVTDSAVLAHRVDGVLLVVKPGATKMAAARQAVEQLRRVGANILGVVLNEVDFSKSRYRYYHYKGYYYSYHYYYDESGKRLKSKVKKNSDNG